jgi:hypothetical protein
MKRRTVRDLKRLPDMAWNIRLSKSRGSAHETPEIKNIYGITNGARQMTNESNFTIFMNDHTLE